MTNMEDSLQPLSSVSKRDTHDTENYSYAYVHYPIPGNSRVVPALNEDLDNGSNINLSEPQDENQSEHPMFASALAAQGNQDDANVYQDIVLSTQDITDSGDLTPTRVGVTHLHQMQLVDAGYLTPCPQGLQVEDAGYITTIFPGNFLLTIVTENKIPFRIVLII